MKIISPLNWKDYELIDTGGYQKLERFGKNILIRPEPQAIWDKSLPETEWEKLHHAKFITDKTSSEIKSGNIEKGKWILKKNTPEQWFINYSYKEMKIKMRLGLTAFRHIGIFPEQAENWDYIYDTIIKSGIKEPKVLNLFAYTGGASLAAKAAGADVVHVDSVKQVIYWARENMEASGLSDIRWVTEDAMKFVKREMNRGNKYHAIILDPPAYGRGPNGEKWLLEEHINEMIKLCFHLLDDKNCFFILNLYSMGFSAMIPNNLITSIFGKLNEKEYGELYIPGRNGNNLPLGVFLRFRKWCPLD
jgi:23S rRNA (cytosine1962-C5)-methyltransferase